MYSTEIVQDDKEGTPLSNKTPEVCHTEDALQTLDFINECFFSKYVVLYNNYVTLQHHNF